jgi:hypothetical protein
MAKALTAAGIARYKPGKERREIRDGAATGLYLILQESGQRSFALRFRKPNGKPAKLTLGPVDVSGVEQAGTPVLGAPLTLGPGRALSHPRYIASAPRVATLSPTTPPPSIGAAPSTTKTRQTALEPWPASSSQNMRSHGRGAGARALDFWACAIRRTVTSRR